MAGWEKSVAGGIYLAGGVRCREEDGSKVGWLTWVDVGPQRPRLRCPG